MKKELLLFGTYIFLCVVLVSSCEKESKDLPQQPGKEVIAPPAPIIIGQTYGGGTVFYLDNTGKHGLTVTAINVGATFPWGSADMIATQATGTAVGSGPENTIAIVNTLGQGAYAASICDRLVVDGYDDWYLPSKDELQLMYQQKADGKLKGITGDFYWSSTEVSENAAVSLSFSTGANGSTSKQGNYNVCAVRAF
ncbi:MAG: DUF1566 domain-containing protein [Bacteroidia bacterium]